MYHAFSFFEHFWSMACHRSRWCVESLGFVDLSRRCHLFCHQHLAFSVKAFFFCFLFPFFFAARGGSCENGFSCCAARQFVLYLSRNATAWGSLHGYSILDSMDWRIDFSFGMPRWNMVKHEVYMGANITTNSLGLAQCLGHLRRTLSTLVRWQLRFTRVLQVRKNLKTPLNLTEISISEVAFEIMRSLCHCGTWRDGWCPMVEASRLYLLHSDDDCSCLRLWSESWGSHVEETLLFTLVVQGRNGLTDLWREGPKKRCSRFVWICWSCCMAIHCDSSGLGSSWCGGPSLWCFGRGPSARHRIDRFKMIRCDDFPRIFCHICEHETRDRCNLRTTPPCRCGWSGWENITRRFWFQGSLISSFTNFLVTISSSFARWQVQWRDLTFQFDAGKRWLQNHRSDLVVLFLRNPCWDAMCDDKVQDVFLEFWTFTYIETYSPEYLNSYSITTRWSMICFFSMQISGLKLTLWNVLHLCWDNHFDLKHPWDFFLSRSKLAIFLITRPRGRSKSFGLSSDVKCTTLCSSMWVTWRRCWCGRNGHCTLFLFEYSSTNFVGNLDSSDDSRVLRCVCKCRRRQPRQVKSSFYQGHLELCTAVCPQFGWKTCHVWRVWCDEVLWAFITHVLPLEKELTT